MQLKKTWIIVPGLGESVKDLAYRRVANHLKKHGLKVLPISTRWNHTTITDWIAQANKKTTGIKRVDGMFAFSMGVLVAMHLAGKLKARTVIAASPSPYFAEALKLFPPRLMRKVHRYMEERQIAEFWKYDTADFTRHRGLTKFLYGKKDFELVPKAAALMRRKLKGKSSITIVEKAPHDISHPNYMAACLQAIDESLKKKPRH